MKRMVKEAFHYAYDGKNAKLLKAGRSYEFKTEDAARFEAEGKLCPETGDVGDKPKRVRKGK